MIRRILATLAAVVATAGVLGAPVAAADTVPQTFLCAYPGASQWYPRNMIVTVDAPATVTRGRPTPVYLKLSDTANGPAHAATNNYTLRIGFGGAASGSVNVGNLGHHGIPQGTPWKVERTADLTFDTVGRITLTATYHHFGATPGPTVCRADSAPPVADTVTVVA